jgi:Fic family protein
MAINTDRFSQDAAVFHGRIQPEPGNVVGYAALIKTFGLPMPMPLVITMISQKHRRYIRDGWRILTPKHDPGEDLYKQLVFALKYEGVNLLFFRILYKHLGAAEIKRLVDAEPTGQYSRRMWFLYEWLMEEKLDIPDANVKIKYVDLLDPEIQYAIAGQASPRHRVTNNLPGPRTFCPLIRRTETLERYMQADHATRSRNMLSTVHADVMQRASSFLMLKDSKASFTIEGESPKSKRATRWANAIGQAGLHALSKEELLRLQQIVIENDRFIPLGFRTEGGFVGEHDRATGEPLPEHISARWQDLDELMGGLIECAKRLERSESMDAVLAAAMVAFGFVFIHPFVDGNGRIHRYLIHHMLARKQFGRQGVVFPVSAAILDHINDYRKVLGSYSHPLLDWIDWQETPDHNVEVLNETIDHYRYFDATPQAEFLHAMVQITIDRTIPEEVAYLQRHDRMKRYLNDMYEMPDKMVNLLIGFLVQGQGQLSDRARTKEFRELSADEVIHIQTRFKEIFELD